MLTSLRFKNWRSLAEQTINFTPITVLIGANSALTKSNIIDALYFLREAITTDPENAMRVRGWENSVKFWEKRQKTILSWKLVIV
ncbi:MAG: AAA family ATPase [Anaerolineae bacterium]